MPAPLSACLASSHSYIWVSALGLEFIPSCTLLPLCLTSVASPGPLDSPDPTFLALSRCMGCCLCLILFTVFCSQRRDWGGICWEQCQTQEVRRSKTSKWIGVLPWTMCSSASPSPLSPCFALLLHQQRAQPVPWVLDQGSCWGPRQAKPSLSSAEGWQRPLCSYCMNNWVGMANFLNNQLRKRWYFGPNRVEVEMRGSCSWGQTGNTAFQISLFCLWFTTGFYPAFWNVVSAHGQKTWYFVVFLYLDQPQNIRIQIISNYHVNIWWTCTGGDPLCHAQPLTELSQAMWVMSSYLGTDKFVWINDY